MKYNFVVMGANGLQGRIVAKDLLESGYSVLLCGIDDYRLESLLEYDKSEFAHIDLRKMDKVKRILKRSGSDVVVNCAIDDFNIQVTKACLELGLNYVDLGSEEEMTYAQLGLSQQFKDKNILGITGMGSTPGINNVMLRYARPQFDTIHTVHLGFTWSSNMPVFVTPFSIDAIAYEFIDSAKILENGKYVERRPEQCDINYYYKGIGKQRTYYTKHIEHHTFYEYLKDMGVKNISVCSSFPNHSRTAIEKLIELGFLDKHKKIEVDGNEVTPLEYTIEVLRRLDVPKDYTEKENIWLKIYGTKGGKEKMVEMDAVAGTLPGWEEHTCNVDTGMPVSIVAQMIKTGQIPERGVFAPEFVIPYQPFFQELGKRKIWIYENGKKINGSPSMQLVEELAPQVLQVVGSPKQR